MQPANNIYVDYAISNSSSVIMTVPGNGSIGHSVAVKGAYIKNVTKVNNIRTMSIAYRIYNPSGATYYQNSTSLSKNFISLFSLWKK